MGGWEAVSRGRVLFVRFSTTSSSRRQCWWWGRIWFISHCDSFYKLCSVSLCLRLPEQTETGAIRVLARRGLSKKSASPRLCWRGQRSLQLVGLKGFVQKECLSTTFMDSWRGFSILTLTAEKMWSCYWKQLVNYIILETPFSCNRCI